MASEKIVNLDENSFDNALASATKPMLVDFWAAWCGPCKAIAPILDELAEEMDGAVEICKVDVDSNREIAAKYDIRAIPTILIFKDNQKVDEVVGLANKAELKSKLEAHV